MLQVEQWTLRSRIEITEAAVAPAGERGEVCEASEAGAGMGFAVIAVCGMAGNGAGTGGR